MNAEDEKDAYIKALTTRDPSKRQIKPIDKESFQMFEDFESESDDDYIAESDDISEDNGKIDTDEDNDGAQASEEDKNSSESLESDIHNVMPTNTIKKLDMVSTEHTIDNAKKIAKTKLKSVMICMMCLLDDTYSDNEIVECDKCGIMVHEDCYKISDAVYMSCESSDASTDPWFCDACLSGIQNPMCELCPVQGGVFKKTEHNRWVHLLCALYTPGVAFNDTDNLTEITLSEIPPKEWSGHECTLCNDQFYARTGVCVSCDAGLCKNYFHVSCAQKEGLLSEPNIDENPEDPYFAQCRQHTDKEVARRRRKHWTAAQNRYKLQLEHWQTSGHRNEPRIVRKLGFFGHLYVKAKELLPSPFIPSTKVPFFLETSSVAVLLFRKKAASLQLPCDVINSLTYAADSKNQTTSGGVPGFSPDFVSYFLDREKKIDETTAEIVRLETYHREMQISEQNTSHKFNKITSKKEGMLKDYKEKLDSLCSVYELLKSLSKDKEGLERIGNIIAKLDPVSSNGTNNEHSSRDDSVDPESKSNNIINECIVCKRVNDQHLMIDCDNCKKFFHLSCLHPPLIRMPKKTKLYGWQCSNCSPSSEEDGDDAEVDVDRPRQLRKSAAKPQEGAPVVCRKRRRVQKSPIAAAAVASSTPPAAVASTSRLISRSLVDGAKRRQRAVKAPLQLPQKKKQQHRDSKSVATVRKRANVRVTPSAAAVCHRSESRSSNSCSSSGDEQHRSGKKKLSSGIADKQHHIFPKLKIEDCIKKDNKCEPGPKQDVPQKQEQQKKTENVPENQELKMSEGVSQKKETQKNEDELPKYETLKPDLTHKLEVPPTQLENEDENDEVTEQTTYDVTGDSGKVGSVTSGDNASSVGNNRDGGGGGSSTKSMQLSPRKSNRSRKRPLSLLDEIEGATKKQRRIRDPAEIQSHKKSKSLGSKTTSAGLRRKHSSFTSSRSGPGIVQPIVFCPSSTIVDGQKQAVTMVTTTDMLRPEEEDLQHAERQYQIGVVAKRPTGQPVDLGADGSKKKILIKLHNDDDDMSGL